MRGLIKLTRGDMIGLASMPYRFVRAMLLTTSIFSFFLWLYIAMRIVVNQVPFDSAFIDAFLPWFTFYGLGIISFVVSAGTLLLYLTIFWKGGAR